MELVRVKIRVKELEFVVALVLGNAGENYCPCGEEHWVCASGLARTG